MLRRNFLLSAAVLLAGCASSPSNLQAVLADDYVLGSVTSVVMLPILDASKAAVYQPTLQSELALSLQEKNKSLRFMSTNEALTRLMTGDAAGASKSLAIDVFNKNKINPSDLNKVHAVLGIDAAIVCGFVDSDDKKLVNMPVTILDLRTGRTIWQGVSTGWLAADENHNRFSSSLAAAMKEGLGNLHKLLPAL